MTPADHDVAAPTRPELRYLSVCSGIEAATCAWHSLGWRAAAFAEVEPFPSAVLQHHYPGTPNLGDMTKIKGEDYRGAIDILVGGTPCQSFSVAGLRKGLADPRGNLALVFLGIADGARPRWLVWENVPGVLSSSAGRDFGSFLGALAELGYGFAYRVLDAQYIRVDSHLRAVPQRRRRVFVVGYLGDWRRDAAVLLERESMSGDPSPRREAREDVAGTFGARTSEGGGFGGFNGQDAYSNQIIPTVCGTLNASMAGTNRPAGQGNELDFCIPVGIDGGNVGFALRSNASHSGDKGDGGMNTPMVAHSLRGVGFDASEDGTGRGTPIVTAYRTAGDGAVYKEGDAVAPLTTGSDPSANILRTRMAVRRLTPRECERLQGFPDDYTRIPYGKRGKGSGWAADGPRYKALGNSMAVNVMRWIGLQIAGVEATV